MSLECMGGPLDGDWVALRDGATMYVVRKYAMPIAGIWEYQRVGGPKAATVEGGEYRVGASRNGHRVLIWEG